MSLEQPPQNKMMTQPPAKKGWHFPSDGFHLAEFIEAETIEEATAIYHRIKRPAAQITITPIGEPPIAQSTLAAPIEPDNHAL